MAGKPESDYKKLTDEELILLFQKEDVSAFNELVYRYKDRLVNFIFRYTGSREESEDLAQDTFIRLYKSKHLYVEIAKFSTWFYTIALNLTRTFLNKRSKFKTTSISNYYDEEEKDFDLESGGLLPDDIANASNEGDIIQRAINSLNEKFREVIVLRDIQDLDYEEIAKITNLPLGTVKSRINRGRECLKIMLESIHKPKTKK
ncbi:MAG: sigma-70 family RNA polymerase sigma factor [Bacteroidetes bacterium]|nr:sigma-70 family RNA polymerase sigma factor [Bacteroidota bacterium]